MNHKFDELTKSLAQSVTRRAALTKFGLGLAGMALACFGLVNKAEAQQKTTCLQAGQRCTSNGQCCSGICSNDSSGPVCLCTTDADCKHMKPGWRVCCYGYCNPCQFA